MGLLFLLGPGLVLLADDSAEPTALDTAIPQDSPDSILARACEQGDVTRVMTLVEQGAEVNATAGKYQITPLMAAATKNFDATMYLISKGAKLDAVDSEGNTALLRASFANSDNCAMELLSAGANPNLANTAGFSPLMAAAKNGDDALVKVLLDHQADVNATGAAPAAIWWAVAGDKLSTARELIDGGADLRLKATVPADPKKPRLSLLGAAAATGDMDMMDLLLNHGLEVDSPGDDGTTPLMVAAEQDGTNALAKLLKAGAEVDAQNQAGETALIRAAKHDRPLALDMLHEERANMDVKDKDGKTALIWAAISGNTRSAIYLIDHGADLNAIDDKGETALTWAGDTGNVTMVDLCKQKGAQRTDLHIIAKREPPVPLPPARAWAMAVGAIYLQRDGLDPKVLGADGNPNQQQAMLRRDWNVTDEESLVRELDFLRDTGQHALYASKGANLGIMTDDQFTQVVRENPGYSTQIKALRVSYFKWKEHSGLAWDLCRASNLVNAGYTAHYFTEKEAWDRLLAIARLAQGTFTSWKDMSDNFLAGREIWANRRDPRFEACAQLLLNPQDPNSPWNQNPWKTDLSDSPPAK